MKSILDKPDIKKRIEDLRQGPQRMDWALAAIVVLCEELAAAQARAEENSKKITQLQEMVSDQAECIERIVNKITC